jgi:hypothetical protein
MYDSEFEEDEYFMSTKALSAQAKRKNLSSGGGSTSPKSKPRLARQLIASRDDYDVNYGINKDNAPKNSKVGRGTVLPPRVGTVPVSEKMGGDTNINVTFKRQKYERDTHLDDKKIRYQITKYIDDNRDLYFIKLVSGALKRQSFQSLIHVEKEENVAGDSVSNLVNFDVKIKYTYSVQLLHAWATGLEKVKKMIDPVAMDRDRVWMTSEVLHKRIIEKDGICTAFARYVAYIMMTETNNLVPRNKTRYVLDDQAKIEDERIISLMRGVRDDLHVLRPDLASTYLV